MPPAPIAAAGPGAGADFAVGRVGQIAVIVQDVERATAFYRDVLGMRFLFAAPPGLAFFDCGGVRLMLSRPEGSGAAAGAPIIYYTVDDIHAAYATVVARGAAPEAPPHVVAPLGARDLWIGFVRDSEGNVVGLMSEVPRAGG